MKNLTRYSLTLSSLALLVAACATPTDGNDDPPASGSGGSDSGSTGGSSSSSGGTTTGSGGTSTGGATGSGGDTSTGGVTGTGGATTICEPGEETDCAGIFPSKPYGTAKCSIAGTGYDTSTCTFCGEPPLPCTDPSNPDSTLSKGDATCNTATDTWDWSSCEACVVGVDTRPCAEVNPDLPEGGPAECQADGTYSDATCTECDGSDTVTETDCNDIDSSYYSSADAAGSVATCDSDGSWVTDACQYCGDSMKNGPEECDGSTSLTCEDSYPGDTSPLTCTASCMLDTSHCSSCDAAYKDKCLQDGAGCNDSASCTDAQCGRAQTCTMDCSQNTATCDGMSCAAGATCTVLASGDQATLGVTCEAGALLCTVQCGRAAPCDITCESGSTCSNTVQDDSIVTMACQSGATCSAICGRNRDCNVSCATGSNCSVTSTADRSAVVGDLVCTDKACAYNFGGNSAHPATVTCESGSSCDITVASGASITGAVTCNAGSSCVCTGSVTCTGPGCGAGCN